MTSGGSSGVRATVREASGESSVRVRLLVKVMKPDLVTVKARVVGNTSRTVTTARPLPLVTTHCSNSNVKLAVSSILGHQV